MSHGSKASAAPAVANQLPLADGSWVSPLLDTAAVVRTLEANAISGAGALTSCVIKHVRYRPGMTCTVLYDLGLARGDKTRNIRVYGKVTAPGRDHPAIPPISAGDVTNKSYLLARPLVNTQDNSVYYEFPVDPFLPHLTRVSDPQALGRDILAGAGIGVPVGPLQVKLKPLRYKPEHRLILRVRIADENTNLQEAPLWDGLVRFEHGVDHQRRRELVTTLKNLLPPDHEVRVPDPETYLLNVGCSINPWQPGDDLARLIRKGKLEVAHRAGRVLAGIHQLDTPDLPLSNFDQALQVLGKQVQTFVDNPPAVGMAETYRSTLATLVPPRDETATCLVHGDFHQGQLLSMAEKTCVLDWDRAHLGDPMEDFGRFEAQIHLLELRGKVVADPLLQAFARGYTESGGKIDPVRRKFWDCLTLIDLALREVRRQRQGWHGANDKILERARNLGQGGVA